MNHPVLSLSAAVLLCSCGFLCSCGHLPAPDLSSKQEASGASPAQSGEEPADTNKNSGRAAPPEQSPAAYETPNFSLPVDTDSEEKIYALTLSSPVGPLVYFNQGDSRWSGYLYGGSDPMRKYGCGPTVLAMFATSFTTTPMSPDEAAGWAAEKGFWAPEHGSLHSIIPDGLTALGMQVESVPLTVEDFKSRMEAGKLLVSLMGRGTFTQIGHFLIITDLREDGTVSIADPASYNNTLLTWNPETIIRELKRGGGDGGPLWAVSVPSAP